MGSLTISFASGFLFAAGLILSGMTEPGKVLAFLDFAGAWNPALAMVMVAAAGVYGVGRVLWPQRPGVTPPSRPRDPPAGGIDRRLLAGALLFGVGWGLVGYCPGPAIVSLGSGSVSAVLFVVGMATGQALFELYERRGMGRRSVAGADDQGTAVQQRSLPVCS